MKVSLWDLGRQYESIRDEVLERIDGVLKSGKYVNGSCLQEFEENFARYCGASHAVGVNSGTDALFLALKSAGFQSGDEAIVPAMTFIATAEVVAHCGGKPVFVDVDPSSLNLDPDKTERAITERTRAILPVHFHGRSAEMDPIQEISRKHNLLVVEDCAQALGSDYKGRKIGTFGHVGCFSFYPSKHLGAYGDGCMIVTNDERIALKARSLREYGRKLEGPHGKYECDTIGYNSRLDEVQAAVLSIKLQHLDEWNKKRQNAAAYYNQAFASVPNLKIPSDSPHGGHTYWVYTLQTRERRKIQEVLAAREIQTFVIYAIPIPHQEAFTHLGHKKGDFPVSEKLAEEMLAIPLFPEITREEQDYVIRAVLDALGPASGIS
jgi:dTDP-4-amino-4,6-dideoxygalactose transaminase